MQGEGSGLSPAAQTLTCCSAPHADVDDQENLVCTNCGHVLAQVPLVQNDSFQVFTKDGIAGITVRKGQSHALRQLEHYKKNSKELDFERALQNYLHELKLSAYAERISTLFWSMKTRLGIRFGMASLSLLGACICVVSRDLQLPLTLNTVAHVLDVPNASIGASIKKMKAVNDFHSPTLPSVEIYVPKVCEAMAPNNSELANSYRDDTLSLLRFAKCSGLDQGRTPASTVAAAGCLAYEAVLRRKAPPSVYQSAASSVDISEKTLHRRYRELVELLIKCGKSFPFFEDLRMETLHRSLRDLISHVVLKETYELPPSSRESVISGKLNEVMNPPSFCESLHKRTDLQQHIEKAKVRVHRLFAGEEVDVGENGDSDDSATEDTPDKNGLDRKIEQLLLDGYTESQILDMHNKLPKITPRPGNLGEGDDCSLTTRRSKKRRIASYHS
ncbi:uncharacterized protein SPPG_06194 [Spizellomyces punctatus DAOM BR117]|uniref:Cyclin-like domain-containing protein n=1 Tax=Spizellomyces punctatus (strain DAOM BR117) TaxID=645134 RepID=A0A0L0HBB2_SPIPD|nr:uncharacterized protein SPPG_06194 [Spizellomyces punctatus DAOM BR117]KNC98497.1 hypothetical protein SPPG_06194 [Spizellomyces punctatus DAOM BR117]|eukprot:XP_016606537.1 hypothetical protein SPPG_06194 [Spizellomyces punctatus DAOM BR117]